MKKLIVCLVILGLIFGMVGTAIAGSDDSHLVTVTVSAINEISATGTLTLTIDSATAGSDPDSEEDGTTCDLAWTTNEASKKITVESSLASQSFTLQVVATGISGGTAASVVTLSDTAANFVTAVATTIGGCDLTYTASATAAQGIGSDEHTILYTITDAGE